MRHRPTNLSVPLLWASLAVGCSAPVSDADAEQAIQEVVQSLEDAVNVRDWGAFFSNFTESADLIVFESPRAEGRTAARALMEAGWAETPADVRGDLTLQSVRMVSPEVAIAEIDAQFTGSSPSRDRATAVLARRDGAWRVDAFRIIQPVPSTGGGVSTAAVGDLSTREGRVRNALAAAPAFITDEAAVWDWPTNPGDAPQVLREGANGWTCFPTRADFEADAPICMDEAYLGVQLAELRGEPATLDRLGLRYMLRGGPTLDEQGRRTIGPHLMAAVPLGEEAVTAIGQDLRPRGPYVFSRESFSVLVVPLNP